MKKQIITITLCLLASFFASAQTIRRCNNNPGITGINIYTTIQAAHDAATAGDIIYVEPSTQSYGNLTSIKELTIIGNGFFIFENSSSNMPQDPRESMLGSINLNAGSASSKLIGISASNQINVYVPNVQIERCKLPYVSLSYVSAANNLATSVADNAVIKGCYFFWQNGNSGSTRKISGSNVPNGYASGNPVTRFISNATITNNILSFGYYFVGSIQNSLIQNNTVAYALSESALSSSSPSSVFNCTFNNNIVVVESDNTSTVSNQYNVACTFSNNIQICNTCTTSGNYFPSGNGNQNNVSSTSYFSTAYNSLFNVDKGLVQKATSPGLTAGIGGSEVGAFGGISPYKLAGLAPYPVTTNITTSGVGNSTTPLNVSVTVRGNN
jgi:hypothetical protein